MNSYIFAGLTKRNQNMIIKQIPENKAEHLDIVDFVCEVLNITRKDLLSNSRKRELAEGRFIAIGIMREEKSCLSLKAIGRFFGGRDHSTIIYSSKIYNDLYGTDRDFTKKVDKVKEYLSKNN